MRRVITAAALIAASPAAGWEISGGVEAELRAFPQSPAYAFQNDARIQPSLSFDARLSHDWNGGADRIVIAPFLRWGNNGDGRDHVDLREAYWLHQGEDWSVTLGVDKVFWGVTESRHLVDIINQDDAVEDIDGEDKLGQPMANLTLYGDFGTLGLYVLPRFRPRPFPDFGARLGGPMPIGDPVYEDSDGQKHVDVALRWSKSIGNADLGLSWFRGTSREPFLVPTAVGLVPRYDQISQVGLDLQYTAGAWLWKLEAINRSGQGPRFQAAVAGFEWTRSDLGGTGADLGLLAEWNHDGRDRKRAPATIYDDDLFLGARIGLNDLADTSLLAGVLIDRDTDARIITVEGQRRFGENWLLGLEARILSGGHPPDPIAAIANDDFIALTLRRSF